MIGYKAFKLHNGRLYCDRNITEENYEFKLDEDNILYNINIDPEYCECGFVFWKKLKDVFRYYELNENYVYYKVESGDNVKTVPDNNYYHTISVTDRLKILEKVNNDYLYIQYALSVPNVTHGIGHINFTNKIPEEYITNELYETIIKTYPFCFVWIPIKYMTKELYTYAIRQGECALDIMPEEYKTKELCEITIEKYPYCLRYVPEKYKKRIM